MRKLNPRQLATTFSLSVCLFIAGCGGSPLTQSNYDNIKTGMSLSEVEAILGKGKEQASSGGEFAGITRNAKGKVWSGRMETRSSASCS